MKHTQPGSRTRRPFAFRPINRITQAGKPVLAALLLLGLTHHAAAQTYTLTSQWNVAAASTSRSMAYSAVSNQVFVATTAPAITVYDGTAGSVIGTVGVSWLTAGTGTFKLDQIAIADDGAIYGGTLQTATSVANQFKLFRWGSWNDAGQVVAYAGDPMTGTPVDGKRIGDTMAITGSGVNTMILCGIGAQNSFVIFSTTDGMNYTPTVLTVSSGLVGAAGNIFGLAFYTNNTFLLKPESSTTPNLYLIQFPVNFASLTSPVAATVLATNLVAVSSGSSYAMISYSSAGGLMASQTNAASAASGLILYSVTNFTTGAASLTSTTYACPTANGNLTEAVALGGLGKTNFLYGMDTANTVQAYKINYTAAPVLPIFTGPSSISGEYPPQALSVNITGGTAPITNQWQLVTPTSTNNIGGANGTSYTIATAVTNNYDVVLSNPAGFVTSSVVTVSLLSPVVNGAVTQIWNVTNGASGFSFLANDNNTRGLAYDTNSGNLVVASHTGSVGLYIVNGTTGASIGSMNITGMNVGGTFGVDQVGVADDGAVYSGNLANGSGNFVLTRWSALNTTVAPTTAYGPADPGNPLGDRWGDTMAVRGSGVNTQVLLGDQGTPGTNVVLFTTSDGMTFSPNVIPISGVPSQFAGKGVAFGTGNTFWAKTYGGGGDLYLISFDPIALTGTVVFNYIASQFSTSVSAIGVDATVNPQILGGVDLGDINNDLKLFQLTGSANAPVLFNQAFFPLNNGNGNDNASVAMKNGHAFALDVNDGIIAMTYGEPATTPAAITQPPAPPAVVFTADPALTFSVGASGSLPIYYQWQGNSVSNLATATNIPGATGQTYTLNFPPVTKTGWYDVIVTNLGGGQTSAPVLVTVEAGITSPAVTPLYTLAPGSRTYLDSTTYFTRGIAYDTNTSSLVVADHGNTNLYLLDALSGNDLGLLNTAGYPANQETFAVDQVGFADDGALYVGNLMAASGDQFYLIQYTGPIGVGSPPSAVSYGPGDPGSPTDPADRWGDTMSVRGAGVNTQVLLGSGATTNVLLFTTADGTTFTPHVIPISGLSVSAVAPSANAIAFGAGNTFWMKGGHNYDLREVQFDPVAFTASVIEDYSAGTPAPPAVPNNLAGMAVDTVNNILASICFDDTPDDLQFYVLSGNATTPTLFHQAFFDAVNPNSNEDAAVAMKFPYAFGLAANNGIVAVKYSVPLLSFPITAVSKSGTSVMLTWQTVAGRSYQVQYANSLPSLHASGWTNIGPPQTATGTTLSYTDTTATSATRYYQVVGQ